MLSVSRPEKKEIIVLSILRAITGELLSKILQHFMDKEPAVQDLKLFANNLLASDHKIGGER